MHPCSLTSQICALLVLLTCSAALGADRPNIIFILTDDQGWGDAKFNGHPYLKTPNLDRLAREGTFIQQFYVSNPVCSPSRTGFMTSHYPARHRVHGHFAEKALNAKRHMPNWLDPKAPMLPRILKEAGYATGHFGKWHLGSGEGAPPPADYGFDDSKTMNSSGPSLGKESGLGADTYFRAKSTAMIIDEGIRFLKANQGKPVYLNLWTLVPHAPLRPTPEQLAVYANLSPKPEAFPKTSQDYFAKARDLKSQMQVYCASVTDLDTQIGRLLDALDELGIAQNTLVIFSSDNGPEDYRIANAANAGVGSAGPLRARKRSLYEGGVRTFCLARWKGKIAAGRVDKESVVTAVDFLPTVCSIAGVPVPADVKPDGEDVSDILLKGPRPRTKPIFWEWLFLVRGGGAYEPPPVAVRKGNFKLLTDAAGQRVELYDIPNDPSEEHDLASSKPEMVKELKALALEWRKTLPECPLRGNEERTVPARVGK